MHWFSNWLLNWSHIARFDAKLQLPNSGPPPEVDDGLQVPPQALHFEDTWAQGTEINWYLKFKLELGPKRSHIQQGIAPHDIVGQVFNALGCRLHDKGLLASKNIGRKSVENTLIALNKLSFPRRRAAYLLNELFSSLSMLTGSAR